MICLDIKAGSKLFTRVNLSGHIFSSSRKVDSPWGQYPYWLFSLQKKSIQSQFPLSVKAEVSVCTWKKEFSSWNMPISATKYLTNFIWEKKKTFKNSWLHFLDFLKYVLRSTQRTLFCESEQTGPAPSHRIIPLMMGAKCDTISLHWHLWKETAPWNPPLLFLEVPVESAVR